jgi:phosphoglycolate phosphatase-like HAD superfamily hydrolase
MRLLLFDVDGTLVKSPSTLLFSQCILNLYGINAYTNDTIDGLTDKLIFQTLLKEAAWDDAKIKACIPHLLDELERGYRESFKEKSIKILGGVPELLEVLEKQDVILSLITGNLRSIAQLKLVDVGIFHYFSKGGFGSDPHTQRSDLVELAIKRAGFQNKKSEVWVIGDTPRDIIAGQSAQVEHTIGVATNKHSVKELKDARPYKVLNDLSNLKEALAALGSI